MKKRLGFVSNSSSASFIVEAMVDYDTVIKGLLEEYGDYGKLSKKGFKKKIQSYVKELTDRIENQTYEWRLEIDKVELKQYQELINKIDDLTEEKLIKEVLRDNGINMFKTQEHTVFDNFVTMYNDIDDMSDFLKNIVSHLVMRYGGEKITIRVEDME